MKEDEKYRDIKDYVHQRTNKRFILVKWRICERQFWRMVKRYKTIGRKGFKHGNVGKEPVNKTKRLKRLLILNTYQKMYYDHNYSHACQELKENHNLIITSPTLKTILWEANLVSKKAQKNTKKKMLKKIELESLKPKPRKETIVKVLADPTVVAKDNQHSSLKSKEYFGLQVQLDASQDFWIAGIKCQLHLAVDVKGMYLLSGWIDKEETLYGYIKTTISLIQEYGKPNEFKVDKRSVFINNNVAEWERNEKLTQFSYSARILGIGIHATSVPQHKPYIERANCLAHDRIKVELRKAGVETIDEANMVLPKILRKVNRQLGKVYELNKSTYRPLQNEEDLNHIFSMKDVRIVDNGNKIQYRCNVYQLYDENRKLINVKPKTKVLVFEYWDDHRLYASVYNKIYALVKGLPYYKNGKLCYPEGVKIISKNYIPKISYFDKLQTFIEHRTNKKKNITINLTKNSYTNLWQNRF